MDKPIRVLQIMGIVANGGVEAVIMNYYRNIDRKKVQFDFVMHKGANKAYVDEVEKLGGKVYFVTPYFTNVFKFTYEIYRIIKEGKYKIVHSNMNSLSGFPLFAAFMAGAKVRILHNHTTASNAERLRSFIKQILRPVARAFANEYWACSKLAGEWMYGTTAVEQGKVKILNNAIDLKKYTFNSDKRSRLRKEFGLEGCFVLGHVGRFVGVKNHEFIIDVFYEICKTRSNARLILVGEGPLKEHIERKVKNLNIANKVIFTGVRGDVPDLYNVMDIFVLPSFYEGLPVVGVEAQANSLPLLCSENVTKEILVSDAVRLISIDSGVGLWCDNIQEFGQRKSGKLKCFVFKGFDIVVEARKLEEWYEKI